MHLPVGYTEMTSRVRRLLLSEDLLSEEVPLEEPCSDLLNPWDFFFQEPINRHEWSDEQPTILLATSDDFRKAQETLDSIAAIGEEIRTFLASEKFKPEDFM